MIIRLWCKNKKIPRRNCGHFGGINSPRAQSSDQFWGARVEKQGSYFLRKSAFIISENSPFIFSDNRPGLEGDGSGDGDGDGGRISGHVQARYSIAPRDQISRSGNPLTSTNNTA